jgi:hypothetical protein
MIRHLAIAAAALLLAISASPGQDETDLQSRYIDSQFQAAIGELPRLAWFLPDGTIAAQDRSQDIVLYSRSERTQPAHLRASLSPEEIKELRPKHHVACDILVQGEEPVLSIYTTQARSTAQNPQVLSTGRRFPDLVAGFQQVALRGRAATEVWKQMQPTDANQPRNAAQIRRDGLEFSYSLAALYSGPEKEVTRVGLFLHAADGKIVAAHIGNVHGEWCADCATPTFADGIERIYSVENLFTAPTFAYPVLMLDTSTMEGRSISLETFTPSREYSRHLFYEYVVGCFE